MVVRRRRLVWLAAAAAVLAASCGIGGSGVSTGTSTVPRSTTTTTTTPTTTTTTTTTSTTTMPTTTTTTTAPPAACPPAPYGANFYAPVVAGKTKTVALTFDDGPGPSTAAIISILESFKVRATFFNIGEREAEWPGDVEEEVRDGFLVGSHTWDHPVMTSLPGKAQAAELDETSAEQFALTGTRPCVFRPPYGDYNATLLHLAQERHMAVWMWSVDTEDWEAEGSGSSYWVDRIVSLAESEGGVLDNPVVLMHNQAISMPATVAALPTVIEYFESHGYTFVDLLGRSGPP